METVQKSLRLPRETTDEIEQMVLETGQDFSSITKDLLAESIKMRRCPNIVFAEGVKGRNARIAGTGIEVWEVIAAYQSVDENFERLEKTYHWLTNQQLRSAIGYFVAYREEIEILIARNNRWTREEITQRYPFIRNSPT